MRNTKFRNQNQSCAFLLTVCFFSLSLILSNDAFSLWSSFESHLRNIDDYYETMHEDYSKLYLRNSGGSRSRYRQWYYDPKLKHQVLDAMANNAQSLELSLIHI